MSLAHMNRFISPSEADQVLSEIRSFLSSFMPLVLLKLISAYLSTIYCPALTMEYTGIPNLDSIEIDNQGTVRYFVTDKTKKYRLRELYAYKAAPVDTDGKTTIETLFSKCKFKALSETNWVFIDEKVPKDQDMILYTPEHFFVLESKHARIKQLLLSETGIVVIVYHGNDVDLIDTVTRTRSSLHIYQLNDLNHFMLSPDGLYLAIQQNMTLDPDNNHSMEQCFSCIDFFRIEQENRTLDRDEPGSPILRHLTHEDSKISFIALKTLSLETKMATVCLGHGGLVAYYNAQNHLVEVRRLVEIEEKSIDDHVLSKKLGRFHLEALYVQKLDLCREILESMFFTPKGTLFLFLNSTFFGKKSNYELDIPEIEVERWKRVLPVNIKRMIDKEVWRKGISNNGEWIAVLDYNRRLRIHRILKFTLF